MIIKRYEKNPILVPNIKQSWEANAVFNGCPVQKDGRIHLVYRAVSLLHYHTKASAKLLISEIGIADSEDGIHFSDRKRFIVPEEPWEIFGCEDPRTTFIDGKYYTFYTALSNYPFTADGIKVGVAISKDLEKIDEKHLVTPFNAKAMALFPDKVNGKFCSVLSVDTDNPPSKICIAMFDKEEDMWDQKKWQNWYKNHDQFELNLRRKPTDQVEVGAAPIKTPQGWVLLYSYIKNYHSDNKIFTFEAVLLDLEDPTKILARTNYPLLTPEEYYEKIGMVPNVIFPSGLIEHNDTHYFYYGATDTTCCLAFVNIPQLVRSMIEKKAFPHKFERCQNNPILTPIAEHDWESRAVFNPAAIELDGKTHILYRAMSQDNTSVFGYATMSSDGQDVDYRHPEPVYTPREPFEDKLVPGGNSGCEDPRLTLIGDRIYVFYTAFDGKHPAKVAMSSILANDFLQRKWDWAKPIIISSPEYDNKDAAIFPKKINDQYVIIHRSGDDMDLSPHKDLKFDNNEMLEEYRWIAPRPGMWDDLKVGIASPPIETYQGWLVLYHGVSAEDHTYRVGAVLCELDDPSKIIARTNRPLFEPVEEYELIGQVNNVVFPCGAVIHNERVCIYYGGADSVIGMASMNLEHLLSILETDRI